MSIALLPATGVLSEDLARFTGSARVACASGPVLYAAVLSEDLPGERWENRWRLELMLDGPQACVVPQRLGGTWIRVSATSRGSYTIDVAGWGLIEITPGDPELRAAFRRAAPGSESRWQTMTLAHSGDGLRLLIEELR